MEADDCGLISPKEQELPNCVQAWAFMSISIKVLSTKQNTHSMIIFNQPQKKTGTRSQLGSMELTTPHNTLHSHVIPIFIHACIGQWATEQAMSVYSCDSGW